MDIADRGIIKRIAILNTISDAIDIEDLKPYLKDFNRLPEEKHFLFFETLIEAYETVLVNCILERKPFTIPYVGRLHVSEGKQLDLDNRNDIAKKYGYESFNDMPVEIYDTAKSELEELVKSKLSDIRDERRLIKLNYKKPEVIDDSRRFRQTLNLAKIKKK